MSLEKIIEHIEKETDTNVKKIIVEAKLKANSLKDETDKEVEKKLKEAEIKTKELAEERQSVETAKINVEKDQIIKNAASEAFKNSMDILYDSLDDFSKTKEYEKLVGVLIKEAKKKLGENTIIFLNKEDMTKMDKKEKNIRLSKKKIFGVYAESSDGKLSIDLTLNRIIQSLEEKLAQKIIKKMEK